MNHNKFSDYLKIVKDQLDNEINNYKNSYLSSINNEIPEINPFIKLLLERCTGGKRIRGALIKLGHEIASGLDNRDYLSIALALEIFQTSILIHDDIIDNSPIRRNMPTIHAELGGDHRAISHAICLGDYGYTLAYELIANLDFPVDIKVKLMNFFCKMVSNTIKGQILDVELPYLKYDQIIDAEETILSIYKLKTAWYTINGPLCLGAISGKCNKELFNELKLFGIYLGIAFQIKDDILGIFGDEQTVGKPIYSDIQEGKRTILYNYAFQNADTEQLNGLNSIYGKQVKDMQDVFRIRELFSTIGALGYAQTKMQFFLDEGCKIIKQMTITSDQKDLLADLTKYLCDRIF